jgi:uncharacterized protein (DUF1919 family)
MLKKLNIGLAVLVTAALMYEYAAPVVAVVFLKEDYKNLMYECDYAMRDHFIAKKTVEVKPSTMSVANLDAAEVGLLKCHEYDKRRKRLQLFNVSDAMLSSIGLEALEEKNYELRDFVKTHEIRY